MSMETGDTMSLAPETRRPMPPEISFDPTTGIFSGSAAADTSIRIESSDNEESFKAKPCDNGRWEIALGKPPRWYTVFTIWAEHRGSGATSEKIKFTFGGSSPKLKEIYVGETFACGISDAPGDVCVYGANGNLLGCAYAFGKNGGWNVKFLEKVAAGDRVCIIAKLPNGNNSMPLFAEVNAFTVDERCPSHFSGFGALPGDTIQIFDAGRSDLLGTAKATATGAWSVSFDTPLMSNTRVNIRRVHKNGSTAESLTISAFTSHVVAADIDGLNQWSAWGTGTPGYTVYLDQYTPDGSTLSHQDTNPVTISPSGNWSKSISPIQYGALFKTRTTESNDRYVAEFYSCAQFAGGRPNPPHVSSIDMYGASGYADQNKAVMISSSDFGGITTVYADHNGFWQMPSWSDHGVTPTYQVFNFATAYNPNGTGVTSSSSASLASDPDDTVPAKPVMTQYDGYTFAGTEATMPTKIKVFDTDQGSTITKDPMPVSNNSWTSAGSTLEDLNNGNQPPIPLGDEVYPQAIYQKSNGEPGATSRGGNSYVGTQPTATKKPFPPELDNIGGTNISGTSQINVNIQVSADYQGSKTQYPVTFTTTGNWSFDIPQAMPQNTVFTGVAYYDEDQPSDAFVKWVGHNTKQTPTITEVTTTSVTINQLDQGPQQILGWRSSDGLKIVDSTIDPEPPPPTQHDPHPKYDPSTPFTLNFIGGNTLSPHDQLNLVSAFPQGGTMSPYNSKPEGFPQVH